jgi:enoyl-CoA hydratase
MVQDGPKHAPPDRPTAVRFFRVPYQTLTLEIDDRVATITINRPEKLNALNAATIGELDAVAREIRTRADVAGAVLTGAGRAFVAGADISELSEQTPLQARARALRGQEAFRQFETCPKPIVAAVNGFAFGGGCELAMACHMRIASDAAKFGQPEVKLGTAPGYGGTQRLPRLVGRGRALELLLTGATIDAAEAWRIGLVNRVVPAANLMETSRALVLQVMANGPLAVAACIDAVDKGLDMPLVDGLALEAAHFGILAATSDMGEGTRAFLEKRAAQFRGV